jgi:hypothetical protein
MTIQVRVFFRSALALHHLAATATFGGKSRDLEQAHGEEPPPNVVLEHRSYVLGAVSSSVGYLESCINEVFANCAEGYGGDLILGSRQTEMLGRTWRIQGCSRLSTLSKYALALAVLGKEAIPDVDRVSQNASLLIRLRNWLIHFQPEWAEAVDEDEEPEESHRLAKALKGNFKLNPFRKTCDFEFPDRYLSGGCAEWAGLVALDLDGWGLSLYT